MQSGEDVLRDLEHIKIPDTELSKARQSYRRSNLRRTGRDCFAHLKVARNDINGIIEIPKSLRADETLDQIASCGLKIIQKKGGYRYNLDALQLADFCLKREIKSSRAVELGAGNGIISLLLAASPQVSSVIGLELQPDLVELAQRNILLNKLEHKLEIRQGDWRQIRQTLKGEKFDLVIANPPYWQSTSGRVNPDLVKAHSRHEITGGLEELISACRYLVEPAKGSVNLIYPVVRLVEMIDLLEGHNLQPKQIQFIHHDLKSAASLFTLSASLNGQRGVAVLPPVFVRLEQGL
ncbi:MAG: methyltransferase [Candidatus Schekmanbacteria bacterium]|nr:methyltransferase [Candidatus Schekmanbacteria bacterium]